MSGNPDIEPNISRINKDTGRLFARSELILEKKLTAPQLDRWQQICFKLTDSGWHAFEAANAYLALSASAAVDADRLLEIGDYGLGLAGYSFEPGKTYFVGARDFLAADKSATLKSIEIAGLRVVTKYPQASNLLADFFATAFLVGRRQNVEELGAWLESGLALSALGRNELTGFLALSRDNPEAHWRYIASLMASSHHAAIAYLECQKKLGSRYRLIETRLQSLCTRFLDAGHSVTEFLGDLVSHTGTLSPESLSHLMLMLEATEHPELASALVRTALRLPLERPGVVDSWLQTGLVDAGVNLSSAKAFLNLTSARSNDVLEGLLGQVRLGEEKRVLQLFAEALSGVRLPLLESDVESAYGGLPGSDGARLYLPGVVDVFDNQPNNFSWLKIALCHQLGAYEFGTFEFRYRDAFTAFEAYFATFPEPSLAELVFKICEDARIDWQLRARYPGLKKEFLLVKNEAATKRIQATGTARQQLLEFLLQLSLDQAPIPLPALDRETLLLSHYFQPLRSPAADVAVSMDTMQEIYNLLSGVLRSEGERTRLTPVAYRGQIALDDASINLQLTLLDEEVIDFAEEEEGVKLAGMADSNDVNFDQLQKGDVNQPSAVMVADENIDLADQLDQIDEPIGKAKFDALKAEREAPAADQVFQYDEWDYHIQDYRRRWCTLYEIRKMEEDVDYVPEALQEHRALGIRVRKQLNMLRPELLRKVKGVEDGEELDLERAIEAVVDRRSGVSPADNIYVQRQRKERDVSALFLLDMSASTDDVIDPEPSIGDVVDDNYLQDGFENMPAAPKGKTIIDLEKESVILMAEALEGLGDAYAVCGFSGYGRDKVEYYVCKDFNDPYNYRAKGNIGGIKPCRSTRMGPAIRHAAKMLAATESRIKALIILSDGYPQDYDYGEDRNSKDYGVKDTTRALAEANLLGIQSFCLTVDPSGHDYLREMCPDQQYMVMQDIGQLPDELSKVYKGLTS